MVVRPRVRLAMNFGPATTARIDSVIDTCSQWGSDTIAVLSGVAGTGKSLIALAASQKLAGHPLLVRQIQFHQSFTYEDFIEGLRANAAGGFELRDGVFLEWNDHAVRDPDRTYVLLIEEFTRANISGVLGELMTYIEHRERTFVTPLSRRTLRVASNLRVVATMNPRDRSALEVDDALIRRLRIIDCPPDTDQLKEMLQSSLIGKGEGDGEADVISSLVQLFEKSKERHPDTYSELMPFGHGMFAGVRSKTDLVQLWQQRIRYILRRPLIPPHPFCETIEELYPWKQNSD